MPCYRQRTRHLQTAVDRCKGVYTLYISVMAMGPDLPILMRAAIEDDLDALAELWHESASLPGVVGSAPIFPVAELRELMSRELANGWSLTIALSDGAIVGFMALKLDIDVLDQLFVRPEFLGLGIGRALFEQAKTAMPQGFTLRTAATNRRAREFYERTEMALLKEGAHPQFGHPIVWYRWPKV